MRADRVDTLLDHSIKHQMQWTSHSISECECRLTLLNGILYMYYWTDWRFSNHWVICIALTILLLTNTWKNETQIRKILDDCNARNWRSFATDSCALTDTPLIDTTHRFYIYSGGEWANSEQHKNYTKQLMLWYH